MRKILFSLSIVLLTFLVWRVAPVSAAPVPTNGQIQGMLEQNVTNSVNSQLNAPWYSQNYVKLQQQVPNCKENVTFECYSLASDMGKIANVLALIFGINGIDGKPLVAGATSFFSSGIAFMTTTPPASGIDYVAYMGDRISVPGVPAPAYAANAGIGFNRLNPILSIWTITRNLAYMVFAIIFIGIGLMIMFRQKVDPKTVASIQNTLPKIIWALVLVTFSYPIAGFLIDLMYVLIALLLTMAAGAVPVVGSQVAGIFQQNFLEGQSIFSFVGPGMIITLLSAGAISDITNSFAAIPGVGAIPGVSGVVSSLGGLIVGIAVLWALVKTWFMLLGAYANIILGVITAPLRLMLDAVPGQNQFGAWLRSMAANLLVFPLVIAMLFITLIIMLNAAPDLVKEGLAGLPQTAAGAIPVVGPFVAPIFGAAMSVIAPTSPVKGGWVPPLLGGNGLSDMAILVALGIFLTMPKAISILQEALKAPPFKYGNAWLEATKYGANPVMNRATGAARGGYKTAYNKLIGEPEHDWQTYESKLEAWERAGSLEADHPEPPKGRPNVVARNVIPKPK